MVLTRPFPSPHSIQDLFLSPADCPSLDSLLMISGFPMGSWFLEFPSLPCNLNKDLYMYNLPILQCVCIYAFIYIQWYIVYISYKCVIYCIHIVSLFVIYIYAYKVKIHIGWAKKFLQIFLYHLMDGPFGQPNIWNVYYTVYIALYLYDYIYLYILCISLSVDIGVYNLSSSDYYLWEDRNRSRNLDDRSSETSSCLSFSL